MSVILNQNIVNRKDYSITLNTGDTIEIRINDSPVVNAQVAGGNSGTIRFIYEEKVL